jgi:CRP-like cAMP-binding protein
VFSQRKDTMQIPTTSRTLRTGRGKAIAATKEREIFAGVDQGQSSIRSLDRDELLFSEGDEGGHYYEILQGVVCCYRVLFDGRRQIISFNYSGDIIGLGHETRFRFGCEAVVETRLKCIPTGILERSIEAHPDIAYKMLKVAAVELASMHDHFIMVGRKTATEKISSFLLALACRENSAADEVTFQLPMRRIDIGDFLGISIETVSRQLSGLRRMGVIDLPRANTVHVRNKSRLQDLAECGDPLS